MKVHRWISLFVLAYASSASAETTIVGFIGLSKKDRSMNHPSFYSGAKDILDYCRLARIPIPEKCEIMLDRSAPGMEAKNTEEKAIYHSGVEGVTEGVLKKKEILQKFENALKAAKPGDQVIFALHNHGGPRVNPLSKSISCIYLNEKENICDNEVEALIRRHKPAEVKVLVEAAGCFSGGFARLSQSEVCTSVTANYQRYGYSHLEKGIWPSLVKLKRKNITGVSLASLRDSGALLHLTDTGGGFGSQVMKLELCKNGKLDLAKIPLELDFGTSIKQLITDTCDSSLQNSSRYIQAVCETPNPIHKISRLELHLRDLKEAVSEKSGSMSIKNSPELCSREAFVAEYPELKEICDGPLALLESHITAKIIALDEKFDHSDTSKKFRMLRFLEYKLSDLDYRIKRKNQDPSKRAILIQEKTELYNEYSIKPDSTLEEVRGEVLEKLNSLTEQYLSEILPEVEQISEGLSVVEKNLYSKVEKFRSRFCYDPTKDKNRNEKRLYRIISPSSIGKKLNNKDLEEALQCEETFVL